MTVNKKNILFFIFLGLLLAATFFFNTDRLAGNALKGDCTKNWFCLDENTKSYGDPDKGCSVKSITDCGTSEECVDGACVLPPESITVTLEFESGVDTKKADSSSQCEDIIPCVPDEYEQYLSQSATVVHIIAPGSNRFSFDTNAIDELTQTPSVMTSEIWLQIFEAPANKIGIFYKDSDATQNMQFLGVQNLVDSDPEVPFINFQYNTNLWFGTSDEEYNIFVSTTGGREKLEAIYDINEYDNYNSLGYIKSQEEKTELKRSLGKLVAYIGDHDGDYETTMGITVKDPKDNGASDQIVMSVYQ